MILSLIRRLTARIAIATLAMGAFVGAGLMCASGRLTMNVYVVVACVALTAFVVAVCIGDGEPAGRA
jgi:hypothetical protein